MIIIKRKRGYAYMIAMTDYGLAVVNQTNSWPVTLTGPTSWTCENENLPQYVKTWLNQLVSSQKWSH